MRSSCPDCGGLLVLVDDASGSRRRVEGWYCRAAIGARYRNPDTGHWEWPEGDPHMVLKRWTRLELEELDEVDWAGVHERIMARLGQRG